MSITYNNGTCTNYGGSTTTRYECRIGYELVRQDVFANASYFNFILQLRSVNENYYVYGIKQTPTINGVTGGKTKPDLRDTNQWKTLMTSSQRIAHADDGTLTTSIIGSFIFETGALLTSSIYRGTATIEITAPPIPVTSGTSIKLNNNTYWNASNIVVDRYTGTKLTDYNTTTIDTSCTTGYIMAFDCGSYYDVTDSVNDSAYKTSNIVFNFTFATPPVVIACQNNNAASYKLGDTNLAVFDITTTGCKIRRYNRSEATRYMGYNWIAIGQVANSQ